MNLRWSWDERTRDLFRWVDPDALGGHRPRPGAPARPGRRRERLEHLAADPALHRVPAARCTTTCAATSSADRWFQGRGRRRPALGRLLLARVRHRRGAAAVLAAASACSPATTSRRPATSACPLVGVGLFYRHGYFRQELNADGWQQERYPDPRPPRDGRCTRSTACASRVDLAGTPLDARRSGGPTSGRVRLYLLDADVEENDADDRARHRPPLRRRHRAPAAPGDPARHRRRAGARGRSARTPRCSTPTRATPASSASSASAGSSSTTG